MSPKNPSLATRLAAVGLLGMVSLCGAARGQTPAAGATASAAPKHSVLLLYNGRVVEGQLLPSDDREYILKQKLGTIRFPKRDVEKTFGSIQAVYQYKASQLAARDPDEHMKLAKWCLTMKLHDEAREQLLIVSQLSPDFHEAKAMLANLNAAAERAAQHDEQVLRTGGTIAEKPEELNPAILRAGRSGPARTPALGTPQIFDLPPALAVRRAQEFAQSVHAELQRHCARCHNEQSKTDFQLIQVKTQRDMADPMVIRANLEATLRLVDPLNLAQSPLLTNSLMPHKPNNKPIMLSPKTRGYVVFATWVNSLQPPRDGDPAVLGGTAGLPTLPATGPGGPAGFASDRTPAGGDGMPPLPPGRTAALRPGAGAGSGGAAPLPPTLQAPDPNALGPDGLLDYRSGSMKLSAPPQEAPPGLMAPGQRVQPLTPQGAPGQPAVAPTQAGATPAPTEPARDSTGKKRKPKEIDPALLEKLFQQSRTKGS